MTHRIWCPEVLRGRGRASPWWKKAAAHGGEAATRGMAGWGTTRRGGRLLRRAGGRSAVRRARRRARGRLGTGAGEAGDHNAGDERRCRRRWDLGATVSPIGVWRGSGGVSGWRRGGGRVSGRGVGGGGAAGWGRGGGSVAVGGGRWGSGGAGGGMDFFLFCCHCPVREFRNIPIGPYIGPVLSE